MKICGSVFTFLFVIATVLCAKETQTEEAKPRSKKKPPPDISVRVIQKGIYSLPDTTTAPANDVPGGLRRVGKGGSPELLQSTNRVPANPHVEFGFVFRLQGEPKGVEVPIQVVYLYPSGGLKPPDSKQPIYRSTYTHAYSIGDFHYVGYTLEKEWELVPGKWTVQMWFANRLIVRQSFHLYSER